MSRPVLLSLFPGVDLLGHAFELEWPEACIVRGPDLIFGSLSDIRRFHPPAGKFTGVIGGPPCQCFSSLVHLVRANGNEPRFGNLIPEYERCVGEAQPEWFLMENVPKAPEPVVAGYSVRSFLLDNSALDGGDGYGLEQRRVRRFSFGLRGREAPCLLRWIDLATFLLPDAKGTLVQWPVTSNGEAKRRRSAVLASHEETLVKIGGSGKVKKHLRQRSVSGAGPGGTRAFREAAVTSSDGSQAVPMRRYKLADACRLQGLPEDFLADCPMTAEGKLKAVANGVSLHTGRVIARAVKEAIGVSA
jgi:DNA (cytosine-5)-methyltransferase 1